MTAIKFRKLLIELGACHDALAWSKGKSLETVWSTCERGDWMLWLAAKMIDKAPGWPTRQEVVLAACDCAEQASAYVLRGEDRPRKCIEVVRAWAEGKATIEQVIEARRDAFAANFAFADAAAATADAAVYTADAAAAAAVYAAYATADAAAVRFTSLRKSAELVRARLKIPLEDKGQ